MRLADAISDAGAHGLLAGAARLPSERLLCTHLRVSRGTIVAAYELLRARGVAETRRGSGTWLCAGTTSMPSAHIAPLLSRLVDQHQVPIDMSMGAIQLPDGPGELSVSLAEAARLVPSHGYAPLGAAPLREAIAHHLSSRRGVPTEAEQVLVTGGGSGALSLIATALLRPGDRILVEAPTYPGAIEVFSRAGAHVEGLERDHAGPLPASLERALASRPARMIYLVPTCHNPTGGVMSELRRREIMRIASSWRIPVIDDTVISDLLNVGSAPPDLAAIDPENVLSVGSLSKCFWGGLRIGWIRASAETVLRLGRIKAARDLGTPALSQAAALRILGDFEQATEPARSHARERLELLAAELGSKIPEWSFPTPAGGLSIWISLPRGSAEDLVQAAQRHGVAVSSGTSAAPDDRFSAHLRVCCGPTPELIGEGVRLLAAAWDEISTRPATALSEPRILV